METSNRRTAILRTLCRRRHDTIKNLALEFDVSERTIRRDIDVLSLTEPIYTKNGRYNGGVYVVEGYYFDRMYFNDEEINVLSNILTILEVEKTSERENENIQMLKKIIKKYTKPH